MHRFPCPDIFVGLSVYVQLLETLSVHILGHTAEQWLELHEHCIDLRGHMPWFHSTDDCIPSL